MKVSVILPCLFTDEWQPILAKFSIETMLIRTQIEFELVVVETGSEIMSEFCEYDFRYFSPCIYVNKPEKTSYTKDFNSGIEASSGDFIVHTATDMIVGERWMESLCQVFDEREDAGLATLRVKEPGWIIGPNRPHSSIVESYYGAFMAFKKGFRLDEEYPDQFSDHDLGMQVCDAGLRCYRNNRSEVHHLHEATYVAMYTEQEIQSRFMSGRNRFLQKWKDKHYLVKDLIMNSGTHYGEENKYR